MTAVEQLQLAMFKVAQEKAVSLAPKALAKGVPAAGQAPDSKAPIVTNPKKAPTQGSSKLSDNDLKHLLAPSADRDYTIKTTTGVAGARG